MIPRCAAQAALRLESTLAVAELNTAVVAPTTETAMSVARSVKPETGDRLDRLDLVRGGSPGSRRVAKTRAAALQAVQATIVPVRPLRHQ